MSSSTKAKATVPPAPVIHSWPGPLTQPPKHTSDVAHPSNGDASEAATTSTASTASAAAAAAPAPAPSQPVALNALDEICVALARFGGPLSTRSFLAVFNSIACDVESMSGLAVDEPAAPTVSPEFGSPEDLEFRRLYATVLSFLFQQHIRANELSGKREKLTAFSCPPNKAPSIPIRDYIERVMRYTPGTKEMYIAALLLTDRLLSMHSRLRLTIRNVHRLFMISVVVASKLLDDLFFTNRYLSAVAGLPPAELNRLEVQFLVHTRFSLYIDIYDFEAYRRPFEHLVSIARTHGDLSLFFIEVQRIRHSQAPRSAELSAASLSVASSSLSMASFSSSFSSSAATAAAAAPAPYMPYYAAAAAAPAAAATSSSSSSSHSRSHSKFSHIASRIKTAFSSKSKHGSKDASPSPPPPPPQPKQKAKAATTASLPEGVRFSQREATAAPVSAYQAANPRSSLA